MTWHEARHPRRGNGRFRGRVGHAGAHMDRADRLAARADQVAAAAAGNVPDPVVPAPRRADRLAARAAAVATDGTTSTSGGDDAATR